MDQDSRFKLISTFKELYRDTHADSDFANTFTFNPKLNTSTFKNYNRTQNRSHTDMYNRQMARSAARDAWLEDQRRVRYEEEVKDCTFSPMISYYSKPATSNHSLSQHIVSD